MMKKLITSSLLLCSMMLFATGSALAGKPREGTDGPYYGNGYPSGKHYNLNIIGKKDGFVGPCPYPKPVFNAEPPYEVIDYEYGNVVFIPEWTETDDGTYPRIIMQSGKKNGRGSKNEALNLLETLTVIDPCTEPFFDGLADDDEDGECDGYEGSTDPAVLQLPPHEPGYDVYIRAHGTPTSDPDNPDSDLQITPGILLVEDGDGNALYYAGTVTENTLESPNGITRFRGKTETRDITEMFYFVGDICYWVDTDCGDGCDHQYLCSEEIEGELVYSETTVNCGDWLQGEEVVSEETIYFCFLDDLIVNGEYDEGETREDREDTNGDSVIDGDDLCGGTIAYCKTYTAADEQWIFNIADFVEYFWDIDYNKGVKLVQVRFYPRPE